MEVGRSVQCTFEVCFGQFVFQVKFGKLFYCELRALAVAYSRGNAGSHVRKSFPLLARKRDCPGGRLWGCPQPYLSHIFASLFVLIHHSIIVCGPKCLGRGVYICANKTLNLPYGCWLAHTIQPLATALSSRMWLHTQSDKMEEVVINRRATPRGLLPALSHNALHHIRDSVQKSGGRCVLSPHTSRQTLEPATFQPQI